MLLEFKAMSPHVSNDGRVVARELVRRYDIAVVKTTSHGASEKRIGIRNTPRE
jgi:hypothetical protein